MALWAIARRAKRPGGYQPKRGLATAVARTTIEVAGLRPSKPPMGFIDRLGPAVLRCRPFFHRYMPKSRANFTTIFHIPVTGFTCLL